MGVGERAAVVFDLVEEAGDCADGEGGTDSA